MASVEGDTSRRDELLRKWNNYELSFEERDNLLVEIRRLGLFPQLMSINDEWESEAGLYPDLEDSKFVEKLMRKQEFAENKQDSIATQMEEGVNPCDPEKEFELTPVQRFIGRFLSPQCPYLSALLYHGVGVGKTCAAITVAENYLRSFPRRSVIIVAPRNIQPGFRRTIFDDEALVIPEEGPNRAKGCTGNTYLKRAGVEFERDKSLVSRRITSTINSRYTFLGYIQFHRMIEDIIKKIPKGLDEEVYKEERKKYLRREFSGRMVIIDEAHNLRDTPGEGGDDDADNPGGDMELTETQAGKKLTPSLLKVLDAADGMKLVLLTGTPMYNSYREIIFLMKLLLTNDKRTTISESDIFDSEGNFKRGRPGKKSGEEILGAAASAYVSFMRGENPLSFPVRLPPQGITTLAKWVDRAPNGTEIAAEQKERMLRLPFAPVQFEGSSMEIYQRISEEAIQAGGVGVGSIDEMVQSGNWLFPAESGRQIRDAGFDNCFDENSAGGPSQFTARNGPPTWLLTDALGTTSPKAKFVLERTKRAKGIVFVYSRFIKSGAIPLALALEANGYSPAGNRKPLLANPPPGDGRQCAMCERREKRHVGAGHPFVAAKYIIITGRANISPNNPAAIQAARAKTNMDGREIKVIIGSQVASEGVDFRFVREIYIFDSWFHLNKMEQVLGRGIRTCSHSLLAQEQRNCTTYLLLNTFGEDEDTETADMYMYRNAFKKAVEVGRVTRVLKRYALDCNLNREAIIVTGLANQRHIDSQGNVREEVNINDTPFTNLCDWIETCEYTCAKPIDMNAADVDLSTYDEYAAKWRETELKSVIRKLFEDEDQPAFQLENIIENMSAVPYKAMSSLLADITGNRNFRLVVNGLEGYIVYRNGYFLFQPDYLADIRIPLALRVADVPVKRDNFDPTSIQLRKNSVPAPAPSTALAPAPAEGDQAVEAAEAAEAAEAPAALEPRANTVEEYWVAITKWSNEIREGSVKELFTQKRVETRKIGRDKRPIIKDVKIYVPPYVNRVIESRYMKDEQEREQSWLTMISWMYDHISTSPEYSAEKKPIYLSALAETLLQLIWDESLRPMEQMQLIGDENVRRTAVEQVIKINTTEAFRYVDAITGKMMYMCNGSPCSDAVRRVFEASTTDPLQGILANTETTGQIYGFVVPKAKERRLIFKTSLAPPPPGGEVGKGGECAIISTISFHIQMLKDISNLLVAEGLPRFILTEDILDEKARKRKEKLSGQTSTEAKSDFTFENAVRACALKNIVLRMMSIILMSRGGKRYFYRPVAALKTGHKGNVAKA